MNENLNLPPKQEPAMLPEEPKLAPEVSRKESSVPPPLPPEIGIRTMESDLSSLKSSGGSEPEPKVFKPEDLVGEMTFNPKPAEVPSQPISQVPAKPERTKITTIVLFAVAFLIISGGVIYFLVLPMIFPKPKAPAVVPPEAVNPNLIAPPSPPLALKHQSYFGIAPSVSAPIDLINLNSADLSAAIKSAGADSQPSGTLKEITFSLSGNVLESQAFLSVILPDLDKQFFDNFEKDFTGFLYYDGKGVWPGYVYQLKGDANLDNAKIAMRAIEGSANLANFYLVAPGKPKSSEFTDGAPINNNIVRYLAYSLPGSTLDYGWFKNYLVISTSYGGFKEAVRMLSTEP